MRLWFKGKKKNEIDELLAFAKERKHRPRMTLPRGMIRRFWSPKDMELAKERVELLRELASMAGKLDALTLEPGWVELIALKEQLQSLAQSTAISRTADDQTRKDAIAQWWGIEGFFATVQRTITRGKEASKKIRDLTLAA